MAYKITHGHTKGNKPTKTYTCWANMMNRCYNVNNAGYDNYGGRGIHVCNNWHKFENFLSFMGNAPRNKSIDRIDNNGNYEPNNCKWSTPKQQLRNRRKPITCIHNHKCPLATNKEVFELQKTILSLGYKVPSYTHRKYFNDYLNENSTQSI